MKVDTGILATEIAWVLSVWSVVGAVLFSIGLGWIVGWFTEMVGLAWLVRLSVIGLLFWANHVFSNKTHVFEGSIVWLPPLACCIVAFFILYVHVGIRIEWGGFFPHH